ncbi:hypothetical protein N9B21_01370 [Verrucomicrobiales bacterium]|nr:hypothetical protein [Verrucomicrobiales bacterium]
MMKNTAAAVIVMVACVCATAAGSEGEFETRVFDLSEHFYALGLDEYLPAQALLEKEGVVFPKGASARFIEGKNHLEVVNREAELQIVRLILDLWGDVEHRRFEAERSRIERKCREIIIPSIEFRDLPLGAALASLEKVSVDFDADTDAEGERGVRIFAAPVKDEDFLASQSPTPITLRLRNVPLMEALRYTVGLATLQFEITKDGVAIVPFNPVFDSVLSRSYTVPPDFVELLTVYVKEHPSPFCHSGFPKFEEFEEGDSGSVRIQVLMERHGIPFLEGTPPTRLTDRGILLVRNEFSQFKATEVLMDRVLGTASPDWIAKQKAKSQSKLDSIQIPGVSFEAIYLSDLVHHLEAESWVFDTDSTIWNRGLLIQLLPTKGPGYDPFSYDEPWNRKLTIEMRDSSIGRVLGRICEETGWSLSFSPRGVILTQG